MVYDIKAIKSGDEFYMVKNYTIYHMAKVIMNTKDNFLCMENGDFCSVYISDIIGCEMFTTRQEAEEALENNKKEFLLRMKDCDMFTGYALSKIKNISKNELELYKVAIVNMFNDKKE